MAPKPLHKKSLIKKKQYGIRLAGKLYRESFSSATSARAWQRKMREEYERAIDVKQKLILSQHPELNAVQEVLEDDWIIENKKKKFRPMLVEDAAKTFLIARVNQKTYRHDLFRMTKYVLPYFGKRYMHDVDSDDWKKLLGDGETNSPGLLVTEYGLSPTTSNLIRALLSRFYNVARKTLKCSKENPISDIDPLEQSGESGEIEFLETVDQIRAYLSHARTDNYPAFHIFTLISLNTGQRMGNVIGLKWEDVNFETGVITFRRKWFRRKDRDGLKEEGFEPGTKAGNAPHKVGLTQKLRAALIAWRNTTSFSRPTDWIVHDSVGIYLGDHKIWHSHERTIKKMQKVGWGIKYLKPHALRHTYATQYLENGGSIYKLCEILNHSSVKVTEKYKRHVGSTLVEKMEAFEIGGDEQLAGVLPLVRTK